jgi:hypothetical protein
MNIFLDYNVFERMHFINHILIPIANFPDVHVTINQK